MANVIKIVRCLFLSLSVTIFYAFSHGLIEGVRDNIAAVKTIQSEDGDVIDCVDINKQPAFDHHSLKNHKIQMKPALHPNGKKAGYYGIQIAQDWSKSGGCPEGTIPILRARKHDIVKVSSSLKIHETKFGDNFTMSLASSFPHEYAIVGQFGKKYYGAHGSINVWKPALGDPNEMSLSQIWISANGNEETIESGWQVHPNLFGDNRTRFFIYWTADNYKNTGCYNHMCPGFVQTNNKFMLGSPIKPVSSYNAEQFDISITIFKDLKSGNWWLQLQDMLIGYWPSSIYKSLADSATAIHWGGEIVNSKPEGRHTRTQMGSGHFPNERYGKSSYIRNLQVVDNSKSLIKPTSLEPYVTDAACYAVHIDESKNPDYGSYIYYGGPGLSQNCP